MIYTAVFQSRDGEYTFQTEIGSHDRNMAWHTLHENRQDADSCLVLLIDGQANVRTYADIVDNQG